MNVLEYFLDSMKLQVFETSTTLIFLT